MLVGGMKDIATLSAAARWLVKSALRENYIAPDRLRRLHDDLHEIFCAIDIITRAISPKPGHEYYPA
ncbi:MAG: hypothetical protein IJG33_16925 [Selenomonadaceae bacterium]|nr:hypothetical protein [Selenomonadaceae bacterium]MBR0288278.1 hypothetical protein [Selenomonadaceae bacterium]